MITIKKPDWIYIKCSCGCEFEIEPEDIECIVQSYENNKFVYSVTEKVFCPYCKSEHKINIKNFRKTP